MAIGEEMPELKTNILDDLSSDEKEVFSILMDTVNKYSPSTTVRVAGGWVRDKLLGLSPNDIDTVVDNVSGVDFAKMVARNMNLKDPNVIKENPEKTKNIESAKMKVPLSSGNEQELDFVQARAEEYPDPNSRNPVVRPGTAEEDAMRRDLTVNSLFFNINEGILEDFTGRGKSDLKNNIMRAPTDVDDPYSDLSPVRTFREDPLRVLRVIRFASRYNATVSPKTLEAMADPEIRKAFKTLARERVGEEMSKIIGGPNPAYGMRLLKETGLLQDIFDDSGEGTPYDKNNMDRLDMDQNSGHHKFSLWDHTIRVIEKILVRYEDADVEKRGTMVAAALMHDIGKLFKGIQGESKSTPGNTSYIGHSDSSADIASAMLRFIKMEKYVDQVSKMAKHHLQLEEFSRQDSVSSRSLRKFIRKMTAEGVHWLDMLNLALADTSSKSDEIDDNVVRKFEELEERLREAHTSMKEVIGNKGVIPALNGHELMQLFGNENGPKKQGPWISEVTEFVLELMDDDPKLSGDKHKVSQMVLAKFPQHKDNPQSPPPTLAPPSTPDEGPVTSQSDKGNSESKYKYCPMHLFIQTKSDLLDARDNPSRAAFLMDDLMKAYGGDEKVSRLIARELFYASAKEPMTKNAALMQYVFSNAEKNFFDPVLCTYALGMLLMFSTATDKKEIEKISNRMVKMAPENLKEVLGHLPENIFHRGLRERIEKKL